MTFFCQMSCFPPWHCIRKPNENAIINLTVFPLAYSHHLTHRLNCPHLCFFLACLPSNHFWQQHPRFGNILLCRFIIVVVRLIFRTALMAAALLLACPAGAAARRYPRLQSIGFESGLNSSPHNQFWITIITSVAPWKSCKLCCNGHFDLFLSLPFLNESSE